LAGPYRVFLRLARGAAVSTVDNPADANDINNLDFSVQGILTIFRVIQVAT